MIRKSLVLAAALLVAASVVAADKPQSACPITGKPVDRTKSVDTQGQRVYFCSSGCAATFRKDPEPVFAKLATDGVVPENVQKTDPICGMKVDGKSVKADWNGRRLLFCSDHCKGTFLKDPKRHLAALDGKPVARS